MIFPNDAEEQDQLTEANFTADQRQAWAEYDYGVRRIAKIQNEEAKKVQVGRGFNNLGSMSAASYRAFVLQQLGFDPLV
jgi:hypothetical protein